VSEEGCEKREKIEAWNRRTQKGRENFMREMVPWLRDHERE